MGKRSKALAASDDEFVDDPLPSVGGDEMGDGDSEGDREFPQHPMPGGDPEASEFRDALVTTPNALGIQTVLEQELDAQQLEHEQATLDALEAMRALDHGELVEWKVSRMGEDDEQYNGYLVTWSNSQMSLERIQRLLGGGKYHCKGFKRGKYFTHKTVKIAGPPLLKKGEKPIDGSGGGGADMQAFMQQMMMMDERRRAEDERRRHEDVERQERKDAARQQLILTALPSVATVLAAMFQGNKTDLGSILVALKPPPPPDPMQQLAALKALMPDPGPAPPSALDSAFTLVDKLKDLGGLNGEGGQAGWMDIFKEVIKAAGPSVGTVIEGAVQNAQAAAAERARGGGAVTVIPPAIDTSQPAAARISQEGAPVGLLKHLPFLRSHLNRWVLAAQKNASPALYAQVFFTEAPDDMDPRELLELLQREDWLLRLAQLDGRVEQVQPWFYALHQVLVHTLHTQFLNPSADGAGARMAGSGGETTSPIAASPAPPAAIRRVVTGEVERPVKLPSLTGD